MKLTEKETFNFGSRGYVGRIEFRPGPRGGRYRPVRTTAFATQDEAIAETIDLLARYHAHHVLKSEVVKVDSLGNVYEREQLS